MSDLSWLNPTPHTITVYASQPLSPVTAQHSLPSGRYALLGPDFHRLDRTSLRLAHSFDHLVGAGEERGWDGDPEGFRPFEDLVDIRRGPPIERRRLRPVRHQAARFGILPQRVNRRQAISRGKL